VLPGQSPQHRRTARIAGVWFVITFIASIPALLLYDPVLNDTGYILDAGADTRVQFGAFLEIVTAIAGIATAVVLFPIVKRQSESIALGYVATRVLESTIIVVGLISLLAVVTLRQDLAGVAASERATLDAVGRALVAIKDGTFLLGPAYCAGLGNGLLLGYPMFRSGLVPRRMALLGVIGGPLSVVGATCVLFGARRSSTTLGMPEGTAAPCALRRLRCNRVPATLRRSLRRRTGGSCCGTLGNEAPSIAATLLETLHGAG